MDYLDFVVENYIWFIIGGVVLLMVIIGYFAEKTDFGRQQKKEKNDQKIEKIKVKNPEILEEANMDEANQNQDMVDLDEEENEELSQLENHNEENFEQIENEDTIEDLNTNNNIETSDIVESTENEEIPEELYTGLDGTPNAYKKDSSNDETIDMDLPNIDSLKEDVENNTLEDDDIWRF